MKRIETLIFCAALAASLGACGTPDNGGDDDSAGDTGGDTGETGADDDDPPPVTTLPQPTTVTDTASDTNGDTPGDESDTGEPGDTGNGVDYNFSDTPPERMEQVDRMGMPAINTAVISSKDDYNESLPDDDADGDFVSEIVASLEFVHGALDDDIMMAGLVPCAVDDCVAQAAPLVVPDVLHIDPSAAAGFPNGRLPADPVVDITLAVVLLDLSAPGMSAATLAGLPLNPPENDKTFETAFPFLAAPN